MSAANWARPAISKREDALLDLDGPLNEASSMAEVLHDLWEGYSTPTKRGENLVLNSSQIHNLTFAIVNVAGRLTMIMDAFNNAGKVEEGGAS